MSLHSCEVAISPYEVKCLHNALCSMRSHLQAKQDAGEKPSDHEWLLGMQVEDGQRWLASVCERLYGEWEALPDGSHLKAAYANEVWAWSDRDLAAIAKERLVSQEEVRRIGEDLQVDDNLPSSEAVDLQGFRRPTPDEIADGVASEFPELADG
jgi:hypothetical protein